MEEVYHLNTFFGRENEQDIVNSSSWIVFERVKILKYYICIARVPLTFIFFSSQRNSGR